MNDYKKLAIGLSILLGIAGLFIIYSSYPLLTGKTMILETRPIDPFDLMRGQYLSISYDISSVPSIVDVKKDDSVYILLKVDSKGISRYDGASLEKPTGKDFIKGIIKEDTKDQMRIEYGIEQYFFERNAQLPTTNITVQIKVDKSGQARISRLLHNGEPINIKYISPSIIS